MAAVAAACAPSPQPRSILDFMDDGLARDGVLARCNRDRDATLDEIECKNARRAAATLAVEAERVRTAGLERESERKLAALRDRRTRDSVTTQAATAAAVRAAAEAAYESQWPDPLGRRAAGAGSADSAPLFGAPLGPVMPSMSESPLFDEYAVGAEPLGPPSLEVAAAEPPANDVEIHAPALEVTGVALIPRPFRDDATAPH